MRIIQTVNDTIRLLFNPKTEVFSLSDFLLVRDNSENFLAQVIEVYDDKFDQEANVAKIKLIYRIVNGNEIVPYDNYTPSRECEVAKIKQSEIEKCINLNKKTILLGTSSRTKEKIEINTNFFDNNCVIFADKYEQTNQIFENLAPRLANYKRVLILDFSGTCLPKGASSYVAGENFKLPLSSDTIDYIQQKTLLRAKLETQVVLGDVFEEVKKFLLSTEENYIPFSRFIKVIQSQCRQTPSVELLVLISWLKKYARLGIFAKNKREYECLLKSIEKNKITTLDLSNLKIEWQKEYVEYITNKIENDTFVMARLNDSNINNDILNSIYLKKKNIFFIPSFAYGYKKASYIMEFAQNYILMPTLNPKRDFSHAAFQIQSLNKESYMIFGEDTKDFIFTLENETPAKNRGDEDEKDKDKLFISLNLQLEDMTPLELRPNNFEIKPAESRKKRLQEEIRLEDVLGVTNKEEEFIEPEKTPQDETVEPVEKEPVSEEPAEKEPAKKEPAEKEPIIEAEIVEEENKQKEPENFLGEDELDYFEQTEEIFEETTIEIKEETVEPAGKEPVNEEPAEKKSAVQEPENKEPAEKEPIIEAEIIEESGGENGKEEAPEIKEEEIKEIPEQKPQKEASKNPEMPKIKAETIEHGALIANDEMAEFAKAQSLSYDEEDKDENEGGKKDLIDDNILDAIDEANNVNVKNPDVEETKDMVSTIIDEVVKEKIEDKIKSEETTKQLEALNEENLKKAKEIEEKEDEFDKKFEEIMEDGQKAKEQGEMLKINEKVSIDLNKIKKETKTKEQKLPVFNEEEEEGEVTIPGFKEGDSVVHDKYGTGEILKVIKYGTRCLLQIEFPEIGKRLLDPKIAKLKTPDEV